MVQMSRGTRSGINLNIYKDKDLVEALRYNNLKEM